MSEKGRRRKTSMLINARIPKTTTNPNWSSIGPWWEKPLSLEIDLISDSKIHPPWTRWQTVVGLGFENLNIEKSSLL